MQPNPEYLSSVQAAEYLHLSDRTVRTLCKEKKIRHERVNERNYRFKKEWLDEYLASITVQPITDNGGNENE